MQHDGSEAQYKYLITDLDLDRIQILLGLVRDVISEVIAKRQILPVDALDNGPDYLEMNMHEYIAHITERSPIDPNGDHGF